MTTEKRLSAPPTSLRPSLFPQSGRNPWEFLLAGVDRVGAAARMTWGAMRAAFRRPFEIREIFKQIDSLGVSSMGIVIITSVFIGMVMSVQFAFGLRKFGGMEYTGRVVGLSFSRELAPTFTAVIVGGRIGAGMAAELGSMAVTEQIDAVRALGADPLKKLVWPRLIASILVMPVLSSFALVLGFSGAMIVTDLQFNIPMSFFLNTALDTGSIRDFLSGLVKTPFFGAIIAIVGCHYGLTTRGGTAGVGMATTRAVVAVSTCVLVADFFLTKLTIALWPI